MNEHGKREHAKMLTAVTERERGRGREISDVAQFPLIMKKNRLSFLSLCQDVDNSGSRRKVHLVGKP